MINNSIVWKNVYKNLQYIWLQFLYKGSRDKENQVYTCSAQRIKAIESSNLFSY